MRHCGRFRISSSVVARATQARWPWCDSFWYSIDMLLPGIQLREGHKELPGWRRHYFRAHRLVGYALLLLVVAGLTGLTDSPVP